MANPQKENGFTPIANEILENIYSRKFTANQLTILLVVFRFTYGFQRKEHEFSLGFLSDATGIDRKGVKRALDDLLTKNVLIVTKPATFNEPRKLSFNKNYETWDIPKRTKQQQGVKTGTVGKNDHTTVGDSDHTTVGKNDHQERNNIKKILNKDVVVKDPVQFYQETFLHMNMIQVQSLQEWVNDFKGNKEVINLAIEKTAKANPKKPFEYLEGILKRWHEKKLFTVEDVEIDSELFRMKNVIPMKRVSGGIDWEAFNVDD